jgi:protein required for attachment to host cells
MPTLWTVVADAARCRVLEMPHPGKGVREVQDLVNPEGRMHDRELRTAGEGRFYGKGERDQAHTNAPQESASEHAERVFARAVADLVGKARAESRFDALCLVAAPHFLGALRQSLDPATTKLIVRSIDKDLVSESAEAIEKRVRELPG